MAVNFIYNDAGYLVGVFDGEGTPENSTTLAPIYFEGKTPQFLNGAWVDLSAPPVIDQNTFFLLFSVSEEVAIKKLVSDEPDSELAVWWGRLSKADAKTVNLGLKSVQAGLTNLVTLDVLTHDRLAEILTGVPL
jgi:hypothetical protein